MCMSQIDQIETHDPKKKVNINNLSRRISIVKHSKFITKKGMAKERRMFPPNEHLRMCSKKKEKEKKRHRN